MTVIDWRSPPSAPGWWRRLARRSVRVRGDATLAMLDAALAATAYLGMLLTRYDAAVPAEAWAGFQRFLPVAIAVHLIVNRIAGVYGPVWEQASIREAQRLLAAGAVSGLLVFAGTLTTRDAPLSVAILGAGIATALFGLPRFQSRLFAFHRQPPSTETNVLIVGAGESAGSLIRELGRDDSAGLLPLALLDDDPRKLGRRLGGVPIVGTLDDIVAAGRRLEIGLVLLAIPSASSAVVRRVADAVTELGASLKVLPSVSEFVNGHARLRDVRDLSIDDLLGRQQIATDLASVDALIRGRRVLVTGGGGSIGSEIVRQLAAYEPSRLIVVDHDETHLFDAASALADDCTQVLLDIRDRDRVHRLFEAERPDVVFHAAAHKHVPLLEAHPCEAVATNVLGTNNIVTAAASARVQHLVFISTDKAVNPSSVMGASKRLGEQLVLASAPAGASWSAVRFGNVLGSRGSVVPTFVRQIREGGPVTVTHPEVTRFFMSIPEAVQLVLQAAALSTAHDVFMLEMGEPVRIVDLAERMISLAGLRPGIDVRIEVTGLRPGEKITEELHTETEHPAPTAHPMIVRLHPELLPCDLLSDVVGQLAQCVDWADDRTARALLFDVASSQLQVLRLPDAVGARHAPQGGELV